MFPDCSDIKKRSSSGSAFVYILIAIALLAALTASFLKPASQQTTAQQGFKSATVVKSQVEFIRSSIQECILTYPQGDLGPSGNDGLQGTTNTPYPINPSSTYLTSPDANDQVANIRCPGNPGNSTDHSDIFSGRSGKYMPPPPDLYDPWEYYNGVDGVFFYTQTDKTDSFIQTSLQKLDDEFSECEADIVDASAAQREFTSTAGGGDPKCPNGSTCFRVWVRANATAVYNGDTDGDEAACP